MNTINLGYKTLSKINVAKNADGTLVITGEQKVIDAFWNKLTDSISDAKSTVAMKEMEKKMKQEFLLKIKKTNERYQDEFDSTIKWLKESVPANDRLVFPEDWDFFHCSSYYIRTSDRFKNVLLADNGKIYVSAKQASEELGIDEKTIKSLSVNKSKKVASAKGGYVAIAKADKDEILSGFENPDYLYDYNGMIMIDLVRSVADTQKKYLDILTSLKELVK